MKELLYTTFVLNTGVSWFLKPGRFGSPKQALQYAMMFFVAASVAFVAYDVSSTAPTYYQVLRVSRLSPPPVLKSRYRELSLMYHPDKNPSAQAAEMFQRISTAHETLADPVRRRAYDVFGFEFLGASAGSKAISNALNAIESQDMLTLFATYVLPWYIGSALLTVLLTMSAERSRGRTAGMVMLGLICCVEAWIKLFADPAFANELLNTVLPEVTVFTKLEFLRKMYYFALQGAMLWSELTYFDPMRLMYSALVDMHRNQQLLLQMVFNVSRGVSLAARPAGAAPSDVSVTGGAAATPSDGSASAAPIAAAAADPKADATAKPSASSGTGAAPTGSPAGAAGAAGAGTSEQQAFMTYLRNEMANQQRFLNTQMALQQNAQPKSSIPWGSLIFLAIALLNFFKRS